MAVERESEKYAEKDRQTVGEREENTNFYIIFTLVYLKRLQVKGAAAASSAMLMALACLEASEQHRLRIASAQSTLAENSFI